jgi:hypothetical protein
LEYIENHTFFGAKQPPQRHTLKRCKYPSLMLDPISFQAAQEKSITSTEQVETPLFTLLQMEGITKLGHKRVR